MPRPHFVRWGSSSPHRGTASPLFGPCLLWPNGWMDQDATWYEDRLGPGHIMLYGDPAAPFQKGAHPPIFGPRLLW